MAAPDIISASEMAIKTANAKNNTDAFGPQYAKCVANINEAAAIGSYSAMCKDLTAAQQEHLKDKGYRITYTRPTCYEDKERWSVHINWSAKPVNKSWYSWGW